MSRGYSYFHAGIEMVTSRARTARFKYQFPRLIERVDFKMLVQFNIQHSTCSNVRSLVRGVLEALVQAFDFHRHLRREEGGEEAGGLQATGSNSGKVAASALALIAAIRN